MSKSLEEIVKNIGENVTDLQTNLIRLAESVVESTQEISKIVKNNEFYKVNSELNIVAPQIKSKVINLITIIVGFITLLVAANIITNIAVLTGTESFKKSIPISILLIIILIVIIRVVLNKVLTL